MTCNMQIDCTKTHSQKADKAAGKKWEENRERKAEEKILKNKRMQAATCQLRGGGGVQQAPGPRVTDVA